MDGKKLKKIFTKDFLYVIMNMKSKLMEVIIMATSTPTYEKFSAMTKLIRGDKIKLITGDIVEFVDLKQKRFIAIKDGTTYSYAINSFVSLFEKAPEINKILEITSLKLGELFYILKGGQVTIFTFDYISGKTIHAKNPLTNGGIRIDISLYEGKISQFIK